tara:strand:- start:3697 stop:4392 length:696 start_codon:yes stop_codon:yes gene_type:complete
MQEPLVLLPGMMCDGRLFAPQIAAFSHERPVMVASLQGANSVAKLAEEVLSIAPPRFALAGLSMGGIVAMEIYRQAPERITRLALMDTNALSDSPENAAMRERQVKKALEGGLREVMRDELKPKYLAEGKNSSRILDLCMKMADALGSKVFADQSTAVQHRPDQCETLKHVQVPALVLCGSEDRLCSIERHELMHHLVAGSKLAVIPGAGHLPTLEQPELTNRRLMKWLKS